MGICQSAALKVVVFDHDGNKKTKYFGMKKMRTFQTMGDVLALVDVELSPQDRIYTRSHVGLEEIPTHHQFQIRDLIIKSGNRTLKYRVVMESMY
jgi:hypothetical protein